MIRNIIDPYMFFECLYRLSLMDTNTNKILINKIFNVNNYGLKFKNYLKNEFYYDNNQISKNDNT